MQKIIFPTDSQIYHANTAKLKRMMTYHNFLKLYLVRKDHSYVTFKKDGEYSLIRILDYAVELVIVCKAAHRVTGWSLQFLHDINLDRF